MIRPDISAHVQRTSPRTRCGFTLIEVLTATALTLILMGAVVSVFGTVSSSVSDARSTMEMAERLRGAGMQLQQDLGGLTVTTIPPRRPENNEGYFVYIEGPRTDGINGVGFLTPMDSATSTKDYTVGDNDDILLFTTRSSGRPFVGKDSASPTGFLESPVAEVAWFVRGRTLYRRVLLVAPGATPAPPTAPAGFYTNYDISVRYDTASGKLIANSLGDLTKPENRFAHRLSTSDSFPYDARRWGIFGLPTLAECACSNWQACTQSVSTSEAFPAAGATIDLWSSTLTNSFASTFPQVMSSFSSLVYSGPASSPGPQSRFTEDIILTNVIGFDVKAWDPGAPIYSKTVGGQSIAVMPGDPVYATMSGAPIGYGAYVDLGYAPPSQTPPAGIVLPHFMGTMKLPTSGAGLQSSASGANAGRVYDTWSTHYDQGGQFGSVTFKGTGTNGFDDNSDGVVDDPDEMETTPPYPFPLRGIQVKIRTFDPLSRQVREVTIVQDFLPE